MQRMWEAVVFGRFVFADGLNDVTRRMRINSCPWMSEHVQSSMRRALTRIPRASKVVCGGGDGGRCAAPSSSIGFADVILRILEVFFGRGEGERLSYVEE